MFELERRTQVTIIILLLAFMFGAGFKYARLTTASGPEIIEPEEEAAVTTGEVSEISEIYVHVSGAVEKPGLYCFEKGARVDDAVKRAVPSADADLEKLNLALQLKNEEKLVVPYLSLKNSGFSSDNASEIEFTEGQDSNKININTAKASELEELPGIGAAYAERIIEYRNKNGNFLSIEEIKEVSGIGPKTFENVRDLISVN